MTENGNGRNQVVPRASISRNRSLLRRRHARVHSVDHFALDVPDLPAPKRSTPFRLDGAEVPDGVQLSAGQGIVGSLREAPRRSLRYLSFGIDPSALRDLQTRLEAAGITLLDAPRRIDGDGLWFRDPDGVLIEVLAAARRAPEEKVEMQVRIAPAGTRRAEAEIGRRVSPRRLGHVLRFTTDLSRTIAFYEQTLGLRLADRSGNLVAFLYSPHGSDHHIAAFAQATRPGFHHASFEVPDIDAIGMGAAHMAEGGFTQGWGFGRHEAGSNFFHYIRDPFGSFAEYFCDIDYIPAGAAWQPRDIPPELSLSLWGPPVPDYFPENHEGD